MSHKTYIIAEMAWGHNGKLANAIKMLEGAKASGAQAIGIHLTDLESSMTRNYKCLAGQTLSSGAKPTTSIFNFLSNINLTSEDWLKFDAKATELGIDLVAMCNDYASFLFSKNMRIRKYVISAASFLELDLIREILKVNHDVILRIGGAILEEIDKVINYIFLIEPKSKITLLAGIQLYPTPISQLYIKSISALAERYKSFRVTLGLADHIDGDNLYAIYLPAMALAYGVEVIEKHITTRREEKLEDYEAALDIDRFADFVKFIRAAEEALGNGGLDYLINDSYEKYRKVVRKKIVAAKDLREGDLLTKDMIQFKRSDSGLGLEHLEAILGKTLIKGKKKDDGIKFEDLA